MLKMTKNREIRISDKAKVCFIYPIIIVGEAEEKRHSRKNADPECNSNDIDNDSD
jgi:hypothetical protein